MILRDWLAAVEIQRIYSTLVRVYTVLKGVHGSWSRDTCTSSYLSQAWIHTTFTRSSWHHVTPTTTTISTHLKCLTLIRNYFGNLIAFTTISVHPQPGQPSTPTKERAREIRLGFGMCILHFFFIFFITNICLH